MSLFYSESYPIDLFIRVFRINSMWFFAHDNCSDDYLSLREDNKTGKLCLSFLPKMKFTLISKFKYVL